MEVVIIPAYNPDEKLIEIVKRLNREKILTIVVDDGSNAACQPVFDSIMEECIVLHHMENQGKGAAIKNALTHIRDEIQGVEEIGMMDADGQHRVEDLIRLLNFSKEHSGVLCLGVRRVGKKMPVKSRLGNRITRFAFHLVSGAKVSDTQTGLRAFDPNLLPAFLSVSGARYEYEMNMLLCCPEKGIPIMEMEIETVYHDERNSCSHFRAFQDSFRIYKDIIKFTLSSMSSFLLDYILFAVSMVFLPHTAAAIVAGNIIARVISAFYNYSMNCRHVFHTDRRASTALEYLILAAAILVFNNMLLGFFTQIVQISVYPAKLATECVLFAASWVVQKQVIFRKKARNETGYKVMSQTGRKRHPAWLKSMD